MMKIISVKIKNLYHEYDLELIFFTHVPLLLHKAFEQFPAVLRSFINLEILFEPFLN